MPDAITFGWLVLACGGVGVLAILGNRLTAEIRLPAAFLFLAGAAVTAHFAPSLHHTPTRTVERLVTVALLMILFDGGMGLGLNRARAAVAPILLAGLPGTLITAVATGALAHWWFGWSWWASLLVGTAIAPTDPAVVFSVLGGQELEGRSGPILEGESGANDPIGIALMGGLLTAGGVSGSSLAHVAGTFVVQMLVGTVVGIGGGQLLVELQRRFPLPAKGLHPLRTLVSAALLYGVATVAHGSGFLAVFLAGIVLGDAEVPYGQEIRDFHSALSGLGEIVAFVVLGITVDLGRLGHLDVLLPGLALAAVLALVVRPAAVGACLVGVDLPRPERVFVLLAGLKGAVPILLGISLLTTSLPDRARLYAVVVVVVVFSVVVQGGLVPYAVRLLRLPVRAPQGDPG